MTRVSAVLFTVGLISVVSAACRLAGGPVQRTASQGVAMDAGKIYPYLVPREYLQYQPEEPEGLTRPLGHDVFVVLVYDFDGIVSNVRGQELTALNLTPEDAYQKAIANLEQLATMRQVEIHLFPDGPQKKPFMVVSEHWASAACILLPKLADVGKNGLGTDDFLISIPHRDVMLLFPKGDAAYRAEMRQMIREKEKQPLKPLTPELFAIEGREIIPFLEGR